MFRLYLEILVQYPSDTDTLDMYKYPSCTSGSSSSSGPRGPDPSSGPQDPVHDPDSNEQ